MKKVLSYIITISLFISFTTVSAYARDTDTAYQAGQTFNWAPYYSTLTADERVGLFYMDCNLKWNTTGANLVNGLLSNWYDYFTMECRDVDTGTFGLGGTTSGYTNLPTGTWQAEDDNGDGLNEEIEYYWANPGLTASYMYAFEPQYIKSQSSGSTYIQLIAQQGPLHQGYDWDFLRQIGVSWSSGLAKAMLNETPGIPAQNAKTVLYSADQNTPNVYKIQVDNNIVKTTVLLNPEKELDVNTLKATQRAYLEQIDNEKNHPVTITFNPNTSLEQAGQIIKDNTESRGTYKYQALQPDGIIGSGYFEDSPEGYSAFETTCLKHTLTNVNITGYIGEAKTKGAIETLMDSPIVALADISKPFIEKEMEQKYPGKAIRVNVPEQYVVMFPNK